MFCLFLFVISIYYSIDFFSKNLVKANYTDSNSNGMILSVFKNAFNNYLLEKNSIVNLSNKSLNKDYMFYIYNTHQSEGYEEGVKNPYNIKSNVVTASFILKDELEKQGFNSLVEERDVMSIVKKNNWNYPYTYTVTRGFVNEIKNKYPNIKYFIDLHRDALSKDNSTFVMNNKSYAKIMFTIGKDRDNLNNNLKRIEKLKEYINSNYKGIMRNDFYRDNDHFNQYLDDNLFLIEVGGNYNTLEEVYNSLCVLAESFKFLEDNYEF